MAITKMSETELEEHFLSSVRNPDISPALDIDNPDWDNTTLVHDWRNHIPYSVAKCWGKLTREEKNMAVFMAKSAADGEDWD